MDGNRDPLSPDERAELHWLRAENALLRVQLDILTHVATGYAHDVDAILRLRAHG
ncbi:hypothetical protein ABTZ99_25085 [Actinosynnema sp. NPDC002837]